MRKILLLGACLTLTFTFVACHKDNKPIVTATPTATEVRDEKVTDTPSETESLIATAVPVTETAMPEDSASLSATDIPLDFQKEGWISADEAITFLKMYLGSYDDSGNEFSFGHESTILKDGIYYYNFRITSLIISESGTAHQSYFGNYLVSTDGNDIIEYVND